MVWASLALLVAALAVMASGSCVLDLVFVLDGSGSKTWLSWATRRAS
jgi:hypothetical protein